uniref:Uncharacterized protein n=1 Tax=Rhizophagus irregularis (strain DAOM 181602 / DAOM 197198 / MUCL 43194) TaxID=747089 RepID=U9UBC0_RHIID
MELSSTLGIEEFGSWLWKCLRFKIYIRVLTQKFTVKEMTAVARLNDDDVTRVKAFILVDPNIPKILLPYKKEMSGNCI